jgi:NADPH-dependent curcumin reductase CurA
LTQLGIAAALALCAGGASAATPAEQQAIVQTGTGGPEVMKLQTVPVLAPGAGQVLVRVYAAAVNPTDWKARAGAAGYSSPAPVTIPGGDVTRCSPSSPARPHR